MDNFKCNEFKNTFSYGCVNILTLLYLLLTASIVVATKNCSSVEIKFKSKPSGACYVSRSGAIENSASFIYWDLNRSYSAGVFVEDIIAVRAREFDLGNKLELS